MKKNNIYNLLLRLCATIVVVFICFTVFAEDVAYTVDGDKKTYYDSLDTLFSEITNDTSIVVIKDCTFSSSLLLTNNIDVCSETSETSCKIDLSKDARFELLKDASLKISNLEFVRVEYGSAPFVVSEGILELSFGAKISGLYTKNNVIRVDSGILRMLDGSLIENCESENDDGSSGGAVYLTGEMSRFEFYGGIIEGCISRNYGGAVYASKGAKILLGGNAEACENSAFTDKSRSDVYIVKTTNSTDDPMLTVNGDFAGKVCVYYDGRTDISDSFAVVSTPINTAAIKEKIINSADNSLYATLSVDGKTLIWNRETIDDSIKPLPDENGAEAKVLSDSSVTYYAKIGDALMLANDGDKVKLLNDAVLSDKVTLKTDIIFDGCGHTLSRDDNFVIDIGTKSLIVTNIVLDGSNISGRFFNIKEGSLIFENGAILKNVKGSSSDFVAPIVVWGGRFTMNGGRIENCVNEYIPEPGGPLSSGALVVSGGEAYFNDGLITECVGARAGGVCIYNNSLAYVKKDFTILTNATPMGVVCNLVVQDYSKIFVVDDVTGKIGCTDGYMADTNIATYVDASYAKTATSSNLVASALRFRHDILDVKAVPVTDGTETLFVWRTALGEDGNYTAKINGVEKVYEQITFPLDDPDFVECPPFAFSSIKESDDNTEWIMTIKPVKEYCKYTFYTSSDFKNWEVVYRTEALSKDSISSDDEYVFKSARDGKKRFWCAEGKDGLK